MRRWRVSLKPPIAATVLVALAASLGMASVQAEERERAWGLSPFVGLHAPSLKMLNEGELKAPFEGVADIIDEFGFNNQETFNFPMPVSDFEPGSIVGLEFIWRLNDKHAFRIGIGSWEVNESTSVQGTFPVQGAFESVVASRKADLSYNEFFLGWRYNVLVRPKRYNLYVGLSVHELFDIDYREDYSFLFLSGPPKSFRKSAVVQSQATGMLLLEAGVGSEWFVNDWLSLGVEAGYAMGGRDLHLRDGTINIDFRDTDNLFLEIPLRPGPDQNMEFKDGLGGDYKQLRLDFDGWKALLRVTLYY